MIPPRRAATMDIAIPVARKLVGKTSVMRQSRAALPQLMTPLNVAETIRFVVLLYTKYRPTAQAPEDRVLKTKK